MSAAYPVLTDALSLFVGATAGREESALGPMLALYLGALMHDVTWADLGIEVPRG